MQPRPSNRKIADAIGVSPPTVDRLMNGEVDTKLGNLDAVADYLNVPLSREEYETFVEVYGYDLMAWEGYPALADMREIAMTTWLSRRASESPGAAAEAHKRITAIRTGASRRDWGAY